MRRGAPVTWEHVRVGVLILATLGLLTFGVFLVGETGHVFGRRYRLVTLVRSAAGLIPGAGVQLAGQNVGQVVEIEFLRPGERPETGEAVAIWMAINTEVKEQIRADSRAQVRTQGLLGDRVIDIRPGTAEAPVLEPGDTVAAAGALDYDALLAEGAQAVADLVDVTRNLSELTRGLLEGEGTLGRLVGDEALYEEIVATVRGVDSLLDVATAPGSSLMRLMRDDTLYLSLRSAVASLDSVATRVVRGEGTVGQLLRSDSLYVALRATLARSDSLLASLQAGGGSAGRLLTDAALYEELLKTVVDLNGLLAELRENPGKYVPPVSIF